MPVTAYTPTASSIPLSLPLLSAFDQQPQPQHLLQASVLNHFNPSLDALKNSHSFTTNGYNGGYYYSNIGSVRVKPANDFFSNELDTYFHNGRYLKQYLVTEENLDDANALDEYLRRFEPYVPSNYNYQRPTSLNYATSTRPGNNFYSIPAQPPPPRTNAVPIQLGSGSLGVIRLPNGAIYLGSGSLGYTNNQEKTIELNNIRNRQGTAAGPLSFGQAPSE